MDAELELQSLTAQLHALQVLVSGLLRSHPAPAQVLAEVPALAETTRAMLLTTTWPDAVIAKFEAELELLLLGLQR